MAEITLYLEWKRGNTSHTGHLLIEQSTKRTECQAKSSNNEIHPPEATASVVSSSLSHVFHRSKRFIFPFLSIKNYK